MSYVLAAKNTIFLVFLTIFLFLKNLVYIIVRFGNIKLLSYITLYQTKNIHYLTMY